MQEFREGTVFAGRYRIVQKIAAGGMGAVYEVVHLETGRRRALKVMLPHMLHSEELRERFKREARIAAHVESEFIVDVSDAGVDEPTEMPYLVMELLRGEELGRRLARLGRLPPVEVVTYLRQAALALDKTHRASIVHRDLNPENLYLTESEEGLPRIKILDFGVAKLVAESSTQANATRSLGTPLYMAPEQFLTRPITGAADIYSLGLLAYTFLVGAAYWADEARAHGSVIAFGMVAVHGPGEAASVRAARRSVVLPPEFDAWFAKATAVDPSDRFPTATSAVGALAEALKCAPAGASELTSTVALPTPANRAPSPDTDSSARTQLLPSKVAEPPMSAEPAPAPTPIEQSAPPGALGVTATQAAQSRMGVLASLAVAGSLLLLGSSIVFYWTHQRPTGAESSTAPTVAAPNVPSSKELPSSTELPAPPTAANPPPPAASASVAQPSVSATAAPTASATSSAVAASSALVAPPPAGPGATAKSPVQPKPQPATLFNND
ncbi:MAG: protein kinase [Byssovorax sp.]